MDSRLPTNPMGSEGKNIYLEDDRDFLQNEKEPGEQGILPPDIGLLPADIRQNKGASEILLGASRRNSGLLVAGGLLSAAGIYQLKSAEMVTGTAILGVGVVMIAASIVWSTKPTSVSENANNLVNQHANGELVKFKNNLGVLVDNLSNHIPREVDDRSSRTLIESKIKNVVNCKNISNGQKVVIINNVVCDFVDNMNRLRSRVDRDIADISHKLNIHNPVISKIEIKGEETHHLGNVPCSIEFIDDKGDRTLVMYKSRDIRPDKMICASEGDSLFNLFMRENDDVTLPVYRFIDKKDDNGHYGYIEFLSHNPDDYLLNKSDLKQFYTTIGRLQAFAQIFGIFDLHQNNVLVHKLLPYLTDCETSFNPEFVFFEKATSLELAVRSMDIAGSNAEIYLMNEDGKIDQDVLEDRSRECLEYSAKGFTEIIKMIKNGGDEFEDKIVDFIKTNGEHLRTRHTALTTTLLTGFLSQCDLKRISVDDIKLLIEDIKETIKINAAYYDDAEVQKIEVLITVEDYLKSVDSVAAIMLFKINETYKIDFTAEDVKALADRLVTDFNHNDVTTMERDLNGHIIHNEHIVVINKSPSPIDKIIKNLRDPPLMFLSFKRVFRGDDLQERDLAKFFEDHEDADILGPLSW